MIKNNKWKAILSSVITLLPIVAGLILWNDLPDNMVSHWGGDGVADGTASKAFMVFGMPLIMLAIHWLCLIVTTIVNKKTIQNSKMVTVIYGILPVFSLVVCAVTYSIALEKEWNVFMLISLLIGLMFMVIGNYLPKTTRNRTIGVKLYWTMGNDENWNKTHRLAGRIWFWGGIAIVISSLLPAMINIIVMIVMIAISIIVPTIYSYFIYKKHRAAGIEYEQAFNSKGDKIAVRITQIIVPLILVGVAVLMFTGDIEVACGDTEFKIVASYMDDLTIRYEEVDSVEYRNSFDAGYREMGYGSPRLSMGTFKNDEFGRYTLYAYTNAETCVVLKRGDKVLVIAAETMEETKTIYDTLSAKIAN